MQRVSHFRNFARRLFGWGAIPGLCFTLLLLASSCGRKPRVVTVTTVKRTCIPQWVLPPPPMTPSCDLLEDDEDCWPPSLEAKIDRWAAQMYLWVQEAQKCAEGKIN